MHKALLISLLLTLAACNTVDGIGRDISGGAHRVGSLL